MIGRSDEIPIAYTAHVRREDTYRGMYYGLSRGASLGGPVHVRYLTDRHVQHGEYTKVVDKCHGSLVVERKVFLKDMHRSEQ